MKSTYTETYKVLINRLVDARKKAKLTQSELAGKLGKPQSYIAKTENCERRLDVIELLELLTKLNLDFKDIIGDL